jgi:hypothetical protein
VAAVVEDETNDFGDRGIDPTTVKIDVLIDTVSALCSRLDEYSKTDSSHNNHQTVIHKSEGMTAWGAAAVAACFFTFLGLILFAIIILPDIHDLQAWSDIYRQRITALEKK